MKVAATALTKEASEIPCASRTAPGAAVMAEERKSSARYRNPGKSRCGSEVSSRREDRAKVSEETRGKGRERGGCRVTQIVFFLLLFIIFLFSLSLLVNANDRWKARMVSVRDINTNGKMFVLSAFFFLIRGFGVTKFST